MPPLSLTTVLTRVSWAAGRLLVMVQVTSSPRATVTVPVTVPVPPVQVQSPRGVAGRAAGLGQVVVAGVDRGVGDRPGRRSTPVTSSGRARRRSGSSRSATAVPPLSLVTVLTRVSWAGLVVVGDGAGDVAAVGDGDRLAPVSGAAPVQDQADAV